MKIFRGRRIDLVLRNSEIFEKFHFSSEQLRNRTVQSILRPRKIFMNVYENQSFAAAAHSLVQK